MTAKKFETMTQKEKEAAFLAFVARQETLRARRQLSRQTDS